MNISTNLLCGTNDLMVNWIPSAVPLDYSVSAVPLAGNNSSVTCGTIHNNCSLNGLQCGQTYNVSVRASSGTCSGPYSRPHIVQTGKNDDCNDRMTISMTWTYLVLFFCHVMSSTSTLLPSGFKSSDRLWDIVSPGLLENLSWFYLLHCNSDRPKRPL